jgi:hypothetical protein
MKFGNCSPVQAPPGPSVGIPDVGTGEEAALFDRLDKRTVPQDSPSPYMNPLKPMEEG